MLQLAKSVLSALLTRCQSDSAACSFLRKLKVPLPSTASSSKLVPFAGRLCSSLAAQVSLIKSLFTEPSSARPAASAQSATLPEESPLLTENTILAIIFQEFSLLDSMLTDLDITFQNILTNCEYVPLLKSTIVTCLDLLQRLKCESNSPSADGSAALIEILDWSWDGAASCRQSNFARGSPHIATG
ncbi:hypothetical protein BLNAU_10798 [Blattamonas nauphoetae]|uniref:Uncharacterized protein n=1 Tax=Blattamonas nauphoetae TaxID=2049346 RepID=A0ABQ9XRH1_9EUKA|nr:hypothetical protein BLNAU_10798 [Blattamonas nauphoetae]